MALVMCGQMNFMVSHTNRPNTIISPMSETSMFTAAIL